MMASAISFRKILVSLAVVATTLTPSPTFAAAADQKTPARAKSTTQTSKKAPAKTTVAKKRAYSATAARQRRTQLAVARTAAARRSAALKELQTPRFKVDEYGREVPDVRAEAAIIYNPETGEVLWENHSKDQRSMASITKVMTALVFLES
jgi:D-alanyl-D-alanine carboxypeptidase